MRKNLLLGLILSIVCSLLCNFYGCASEDSAYSQTYAESEYEFTEEGKIILYQKTPYYGFVDEDNQLIDTIPVTDEGNAKLKKLIIQRYRTAKDNTDFVIQDYLNGVSIVRYKGNEATVKIPEMLDGKTVIKIGGYFHNYNISSDPLYMYRPAFDCSKIRKIILPKSIKEIVHNSFHTVSYSEDESLEDMLETIEVSSENQYYSSDNGMLYSKDKSILLCVPSNNNFEELNLDLNTTTAYEIISANTIKLNIPLNLKEIFAVDYDAISESKVISKTTTEVFESAENTALKEIAVSNNNKSFSSKDGVFYNRDGTELIMYPYNKQDIEFKVPSNVKKVDDFCINNIKNLKTFIFNRKIEDIKCYVFYSPDEEWRIDSPTLTDVKGYKNTIAEKWAKENNLNFTVIKK